jgi:hypothetical protein
VRAKLLLFALTAFAGFGQNANLAGLPEYGVILEGTINAPKVVNNSGKSLLGHVLHYEDSNGEGKLIQVLTTNEIMLNGHLQPVPTTWKPAVYNGVEPVKVMLDAVIFEDGHFVGPDKGQSFDKLSEILDAQVALARRVMNREPDIWTELENLTKPSAFHNQTWQVHSGLTFLVRDLIYIKNHYGEDKALKIAEFSASLPKLWR